ncbi:MAG: 16S rRNA (adenine(1518)-N(6)/adenine(1519)-N(6))-dimethyltransferase, partial [Candidatus Kerfeldbacteria bacterium]|nr:16S rRNA (adenine(1518)-N(6)/adenine(1519)-N(6))-dimethyltransferase [Candidatus Kerfeldbacteria bacterium]
MIDWKYIHTEPLEALTDSGTIQQLCDQFQIKPTRGAGQNFLIDPSILDEMLEAAEIKKSDSVLEIGSGFGALTIALAQKAKQVIAVEKDPRIFEALAKIVESHKNVKLVQGDILKIPNYQLPIPNLHNPSMPPLILRGGDDFDPPLKLRGGRGSYENYKLVANLPYSITSAVLRRFISPSPSSPPIEGGEMDGRPKLLVVMVQKEVAERVCAQPGEMSLLSVAVQFYAKPEIVRIVPRSAFWPEPEVESAILRIVMHQKPLTLVLSPEGRGSKGEGENLEKKFFQIVRIGFSSRRKQLQNNLAAGLHISN